MITPRFHIEQTDSDVTFTIHAPYASIADAEIYADLDTFCFYASPYYLRLHLPGNIEETDASKGSYDADSGTFVICVQKITQGEHFPDLDLITSLLTPLQQKKADISKPKVEVIGSNDDDVESDGDDYEDDGGGSEWYIEQSIVQEPSQEFLLSTQHYGFANQLSGVFHNFKTEFLEVVEIPDPDRTPASERGNLRVEQEASDFSDDHYLADWDQSELIEPFLQYEMPWKTRGDVKFTGNELDIMKDLPKKEFLLDQNEECIAGLSLVDILYAYAYNARTTLGENTVESAWTINKLSATLNWLQTFSTIPEVVATAVRRSLCYPLYRHWDLALKVLSDVKDILRLGKRQVLQCLLEIYSMFSMSEPRYLLNQLFIRDYCIWIQQVTDKKIESLLTALSKVQLSKSDVSLDLEELEAAALAVQEDYAESKLVKCSDKLSKHLDSLHISNQSDSSDSSDSNSSEDSEDSSTSELDSDDLSDD